MFFLQINIAFNFFRVAVLELVYEFCDIYSDMKL